MMASITQFKHSSVEKRGMGLTFLGMMTPDEKTILQGDYVAREDFETAVRVMQREIAHLGELVHLHVMVSHKPWYRKLWEKLFH